MVEIEREAGIADALDHLIEAAEQRFVAQVLVVERRQGEDAGDAERQGMPGKTHGVAERAAAGADQHAIARQAGVEDGLQKRDALLERERVGLARGTEYHQTVAALVQQPAGVGDEARRVWLQILIDGRQHGAPHARDAGSCRALRRCRRASFLELGRHGAPPAAQPAA